ncbi:MAG: crotonobetaine/carnitine-CoA ligase [Verrucomicrobiales bacterium]|jgi:crotonobetaine/carnitine-CoA ligase
MANRADATTFARLWADTSSRCASQKFLIFEGPDESVQSWTYGEFDDVVGRVAGVLVREGVRQGSAVHLALTNCPTFVAVWIAAARLGAFIVPGDPMGKTPEFADQIERTVPAVGIHSIERAAAYLEARPDGMATIAIDEADASFDSFDDEPFTDWPTPGVDDTAAVMFTSGTTGRPKGVVITQANYAFAGKTMANAADLGPTDRHLVVLPLFHANAQYYSFASAIWAGASVALMHTFSASGFLAQAAWHNATCASLFAAPIRMILARSGPQEGLSLRHCWFAQNIGEEQYETISDWLGCRPRQLYGMTETIPAVLTDESMNPRHDMMGYVTAGCEVEVHDSDGARVTPGEVGELVVRGQRGVTIFDRYLDDPDTTNASFRDGWFLTGDRATVDDNGRFAFDGRRSDILKVAGENVSTVEVESVLSAHPAVLEAAVVGAPDPVRDEVPIAYVVANDPSQPPREDDLLAWCESQLGKAKVPTSITFLDELPRTSVGKIRKFVLRKEEALQ